MLHVILQPITNSNVVYFESKEELDALVEKGAVLAKFHQTWCGHCKTMKKVLFCFFFCFFSFSIRRGAGTARR